jgi:uncharacterized protein YndB with AHSA1/START domain
MLSSECSIIVNRPVEEVFAFVSDAQNDPSWHTTVLSAVRTSEGPIGLGTTASIVYKGLGQHKMQATVVEFEPPRRVVIEATFVRQRGIGPRVMGTPRLGFSLEPVERGTRITRRVEFQPSGVFRLLEHVPLLRSIGDRRNLELLNNMKALLERGSSQPS